MAGVFQTISDALAGKTDGSAPTAKADGGTVNKVGHDSRDVQNPNLKKLKDLGLKSMPEGGQAELDSMYSKFQAKNKPKSRLQKLYKDAN